MNVVQINGSYGNADSTGRTTKEMHKWFVEHGVKSYCFVTQFNEGFCDDRNVWLFGNKVSARLHSLLSHITGLQGYFSQIETKKLIKKLKKCNPDVIILRVLHNNSINFNKLTNFLAQEDIPTILVLHDTWYFTGHCCGFVQFDCYRWENVCGNCPALHVDNESWFFDTSSKSLKDKSTWFNQIPRLIVVGVSEFMEQCAKRSVLNGVSEVTSIYNWIDLEVFKPMDASDIRKKYNVPIKKKVVLGVASYWSEGKGFPFFLRLAENMDDVLFILIGNYDKSKNDYPTNMRFEGVVKNPSVLAEYYNLSNVLLNLATCDSFGKVTAEAMSCGIPAIAYNRAAAIELIGIDRGRLCRFNDYEDVHSAIEEILETDKDAWVSPLRKFAEENFDKAENIRKYLSIIDSTYEHGGLGKDVT